MAMTKETKIGLLVGLAFIILFGIILSEKGTSPEQFATPSMSAYHPVVELVPPQNAAPPQLARASHNIANKMKFSRNITNIQTNKSAPSQQKIQNSDIPIHTEKNIEPDKIAPEMKKLIPTKSTKALTKQIPASAPTIRETEKIRANQPMQLAKNIINKPKKHNIIGTHLVAPGETLVEICKKYYPGRAYKMIKKVMTLNNISKPERLRAGQNLKLPADEANSLAQNSMPNSENQPVKKQLLIPTKNPQIAAIVNIKPANITLSTKPQTKNTQFKTYTVKSNDSLCKIAKKFYGSEQAWKKIYKYNRDILKNPDRLRSGIKLKLPANEELAVGPNMPD